MKKEVTWTTKEGKVMYDANPKINRTTASEILQVSRKTIQRYIKKLEQ
jgi:transcriptional antiterminator